MKNDEERILLSKLRISNHNLEIEKSDSEFLSYNLMLYSGKKICALRDLSKKNSNSRVVRKKNSERNKKQCIAI
jgi:hypothetical protein